MSLRYLSVCSGIEAASVAWAPLGWAPWAFAEVEPFPCAVLAHHYPDTPNLGDLTQWETWPDATIDLLVGGTPCQSFSVAGLRKGLHDPRGGLLYSYLAVAGRYRPRWLVWENVPGVLSIDDGRAFGSLLGGLAELGYGFAWRVLDAQFVRVDGYGRAVPQRRRRVFVVGHLGDWRRAAAVFLERASLSGHPAPRREAGEGVAATITSGPGGCSAAHGQRSGDARDRLIVPTVANPLTARMTKGVNTTADEGQTMIAHALRGEGFDASEDGTGRGTPLVPVSVALRGRDGGAAVELGDDVAFALRASQGGGDKPHVLAFSARQDPDVSGPVTHPPGAKDRGHGVLCDTFNTGGITLASAPETHAAALLRALSEQVGAEAFTQWGLGILDSLLPAEVLRSRLHGCGVRLSANFSRRWLVYHALSRAEAHSDGIVCAMREAERAGRASQGWRPPEQLARELGAYLSELSQPGAQAARFMRDLWQASEGVGLLRQALSAVQEVGRPARSESESAHGGMRVRRLTVEECEFLQGFPRGYTLIPHRGKLAADGPRYKALGNSFAVNVVRWIGQRIAEVDGLARQDRPARP